MKEEKSDEEMEEEEAPEEKWEPAPAPAPVSAPAPEPAAKKPEEKAEPEADEENDEEWITPDNITKGIYFGKEKLGPETRTVATPAVKKSIGIVTSDFAMQNVILQIGIPLFSADGVKIDGVKQFVWRCRACKEYVFFSGFDFERTKEYLLNRVNKNPKSEFCTACGNHTLEKVTVKVDAQGNVTYGAFRRKINLRGTIVGFFVASNLDFLT